MIVHNLDIMHMSVAPSKTDAPSFIDADAVLADAIPLQGLQVVSPYGGQIIKTRCRIEPAKPLLRRPLDALKLPASEPLMQESGFCTPEGLDHMDNIVRVA
jgi:hypothetical protein